MALLFIAVFTCREQFAKSVLAYLLVDPVDEGGNARVDGWCANTAAGVHAPRDDAYHYALVLHDLGERTAGVTLKSIRTRVTNLFDIIMRD